MISQSPEETQTLPLKRAYQFLAAHGFSAQAESIRTSNDAVPGTPRARLKRGRIVTLLKGNGLLDEFIESEWRNGKTEDGKLRLKKYFDVYERWTSEPILQDNESEEEDGGEFAQEDDLRDYLAKNLHVLEKGMVPWPVPGGEDNAAVEFKVDEKAHRVDILAKDCKGVPVVIELKVSRGHEKTIGQSLYYRARVRTLLKADKVRIIIVAREISAELRVAASEVDGIDLFQYHLSMSVSKVAAVGA